MDRSCPAWVLDNGFRRRLAPAGHDVRYLGVASGMTVADLGTGVGYHVAPIVAALGGTGRLYACDIDAENLAIARTRPTAGVNATFVVRSATSVPEIPSSSVDRVLLSLVICCLVDKEGAMREAWRVLKPGGRSLVSYPRGGLRFGRRRRALAMSRARWRTLVTLQPWRELPVPSNLGVRRHLVEKPNRDAVGTP
jgi:SAM-dependent methyltransferase